MTREELQEWLNNELHKIERERAKGLNLKYNEGYKHALLNFKEKLNELDEIYFIC